MKQTIQHIRAIARKDIFVLFKNPFIVTGTLLFLVAAVFIIYFVFTEVKGSTWNALYWIILLFANSFFAGNSFMSESHARDLYYHQIAKPNAIIVSKLLINLFVGLFIAAVLFVVFVVILGNPVIKYADFAYGLILGCIALNITFTFVGAISIKAIGNSSLVPILGFPLIIPIISFVIQLTSFAFAPIDNQDLIPMLTTLFGISLIQIALALILFPYLWQE